ncbi:hypothetical protein [Roseomonas sp. AR75]|uniref:hypothetical protein n=1 Tax=Roseomonas sp. AR75 TaxID=2562311 RepID=UPI0010C098CD|nr:hypothetical protein [Roseomonas sp. AR75]
MDGSIPASSSQVRLTEREADLARRIADERLRPAPDDVLLRRLMRERMLARERLAALAGAAMPRWARQGQSPTD